MNWLNLRTENLRSPQMMRADNAKLGVWLRVLVYCCEQENGGTIPGGAAWTDRDWMYSAGVTAAEIEGANPLVFVEGENVRVFAYPIEKQIEIAAKRRSGRKGGKNSRKSEKNEADLQAGCEADLQGELEADLEAVRITEGKGREGNRKGKKEKGTLSEFQSFAESLSLPSSDGEARFHALEANGWTNGGKPVKDWRALMRSWKAAGYHPSQKSAKDDPAPLRDRTHEVGFGEPDSVRLKRAWDEAMAASEATE